MESLLKDRGVTGSHIEWLLRRHGLGKAKAFAIHGSNDGYTATVPDNILTAQSNLKNVGSALLLSRLRIQDASGPEAKLRYVDEQVESTLDDVSQLCERLLFDGDPTSDSTHPLGLNHTIKYASTYAGVTRAQARGACGNRLNAATVTTDIAKGTTTATVTRNSATVTLAASQTWKDGDLVFIADENGAMQRYYANGDGSASTALTIAPAFEYEGAAGRAIRIVSPFLGKGSANERTLSKINQAIALASDSGVSPDFGYCDEMMHAFLNDEVIATEFSQTTAEKGELGAANRRHFMYRGMRVEISHFAGDGNFYGVNSKHLELLCGKGYDRIHLAGGKLKPEASVQASGFQNEIGEVIMRFELCSKANNRHFLIENMTD